MSARRNEFATPIDRLRTPVRDSAASCLEAWLASLHDARNFPDPRAAGHRDVVRGVDDRIRSAATTLVEQFDDESGRLSQLALALSEPTYLRAFARKARDPLGAELDDDERKAVSRVQQFARALSLTDSVGGYIWLTWIQFIREFAISTQLWGELREERLRTLLGRPVYEAEDMDGTLTASTTNYIAIIGDFLERLARAVEDGRKQQWSEPG